MASSYCSSLASTSVSSANRRLVIFLPPLLTFPLYSSRASDMIRSRKNVAEGGRQKKKDVTCTAVFKYGC